MLLLVVLGGCRATTVGEAATAPSPTAAVPPATAAPARPTSAPAPPKPAGAVVEVDREAIADQATWSPGQLTAHFQKHGREMPWASESVYDASARETVRIGAAFTYRDREANMERLGFYHRESNRFVGVTRDGRRITTQFRPDRGEGYVRALDRSTYR